MISIAISEAINGFTVSVYDSNKRGPQLPENVERYIDALSLIRSWVTRELNNEAEKIKAGMKVL